MKYNIKDKVIIVTGASSGIGKQIAISLSEIGAKCVLLGRNKEKLISVQSLCVNETLIYDCDLTLFDGYEKIVSEVVEKFGKIYGFVHSAGIEQTIPLQILKVENLEEIFKINVFSPIEFIKILSKNKYKDDNQSLVIISSIMGVVGNKGLTSYSASKGAIIAMIKSMALELAKKNIRINAVSPGHIKDSEMSIEKESKLSNESIFKIIESHPLGLGSCKDVSNMVSFLLSEDSNWITGQNFIVDGGYTIQ